MKTKKSRIIAVIVGGLITFVFLLGCYGSLGPLGIEGGWYGFWLYIRITLGTLVAIAALIAVAAVIGHWVEKGESND